MNSLVSIVIPTYSRNDTLERAISSALNQSYKNIEILVIDDNPENSEWRQSTALMMKKYIDDSRIIYIQNSKNLGGSGARNNGIKNANGEYIAFLDDDDEYLPFNIEKKILAFENNPSKKLALVYGFCEYIDNGRIVYTEKKNYNGCCIYDAIEQNCIAATSQWVVKKNIIENIGGFSIVPSKQDSQTMLKLLGAGYEIKCVPEVLSRYYMDYENRVHISNNGRKPLEGELIYYRECKKYYGLFNANQKNNIEFSFAKRFYEKYKDLNDKSNYVAQRKRMFRLKFFDSLKYFIYIRLQNLKHQILNKN